MPIESTPEIAWRAISPVLALVGGALLTLTMVAVKRAVSRGWLAGVTLATVGAASYLIYDLVGERHVGMQGMIAIDGVSLFANAVLLATTAIVTVISYDYLEARRLHRGEFYPLLLFATAGMSLLASANDLVMIFIALEVLSLALYILVGLARRDPASQEGSMKYFLLGAFSSAILLYGLALVYGATGETNLAAIATAVVDPAIDRPLIFLALGMLGVGLAFKIAAVPFHMWTPDAYQGAPTNVTGFMAAATKAAAFAALLRVFIVGFGALQWDWRPAMWGLAILTMVVGSLLAIAQTDVKRMLAYSSIAHAGFILVGLVAANEDGTAGTLFYLMVYALMTLGAFAAVMASAPGGEERLDMAAWTGMGQRHPVFAGAMTLFLLSLAGIPPTAGFMGKFYVFNAAMEAGETGLVVAGVLASAIAAFFYLRVIVLMWLSEPAGEVPIGMSTSATVGLGITAAATIALGVWPQGLMDIARQASIFTG